MITIGEVEGAIFDVDDTLLDNKPGQLGQGLHEKSRFAAFQFVGRLHAIPQLENITPEDNVRAFLDSPVHTLSGAVWNYLWMSGLVDTSVMDPNNALLQAIVAKKNELHVAVLRDEGEEVAGASAFVRSLAAHGLETKLAIASSAIRRDIDVFLAKVRLQEFFPDSHIKSLESATHPKPHPELFNLAFASLGLPEASRARVLAFEDDPRGIMSAKAAGLYTCAITTRYKRTELAALEVAPDLIADSYQEFAELFGLGELLSAVPSTA